MDLAGKNAGSMFGPGIYMAESSTCLKKTTKMSVSENREPMKTKVSDVFSAQITFLVDLEVPTAICLYSCRTTLGWYFNGGNIIIRTIEVDQSGMRINKMICVFGERK